MKRTFIMIGIILAISAFFFRAYLFGGKLLFPTNMMVAFYPPWNSMTFPGWKNIPFKGLGHDNVLLFYPEKLLLRLSAAEKSLPLWNPYNFAGTQLMGDGEAAPMYPLTLLYLILPLPEAFSVMVILVPTLTMLFTYGMLRHFRLGRLAALFGAVAFAFSGFMSGWMEDNPAVAHSAIWLPLLIWLEDLLITTPKRRWFFLFAAVVAVMMSAGFLQLCLYELCVVAVYALVFGRKRLGPVILSGTIGLLLVAPYLATTWEAYKLSPRDFVTAPEIRSIFLVSWSHILSLFNPDWLGNPGSYNYVGPGSYYDRTLFIGVVPLLFVLLGIRAKKSVWEKFFWWTAGVTLFLGFSSPVTQWLFSLPIPILSTMLPSRIFYLTSFALSIIAAISFDRMNKYNWFVVFVIFLLAFLMQIHPLIIRNAISPAVPMDSAIVAVAVRNVGVSILLFFIATGALIAADKQKKFRAVVSWFLIFITVLSAWYFTGKSLYDGERQFLYPAHPALTKLQQVADIYRIGFANVEARIRPDVNVVYGLYGFEGMNPVFPYRFGQFVRSANNDGRLARDIPRISVELDLKDGVQGAPTSARIQTLLNLTGVKYILDHKKNDWYLSTYPTHKLIWEDENFRIWENNEVFPRAFIVSDIIVKNNPQEILDALYTEDLLNTAIVEEPISITKNAESSDAEIISYRMGDLTIQTHAGGLLVVTDTYAPGWHALVDGKEVPIYRTDFTFRGVPVPAGDHTVFMYYWPDSLVWGIRLMTVGIILLLGSLLQFFRKPDAGKR